HSYLALTSSSLHKRPDSYNVISLAGQHIFSQKHKLLSSLICHFKPKRDDIRGIEKWGQSLWKESDLGCRRLSNGHVLFTFPSEASTQRALHLDLPTFKGATLSLALWSNLLGAFKKHMIWLRVSNIPLNAPPSCLLATSMDILSQRIGSCEFLPMDSIQLLIEVLDSQSIPSKTLAPHRRGLLCLHFLGGSLSSF
ncbi:hypothetical protein AMTR_s00105p00072560, partial [Amborella trichopoda]